MVCEHLRWMVARDHIGICPLYTCLDIDGNRWFASEIKALQHLTEHIVHVPPGHMMTGCGVVSAKMVENTRAWYKPDWMSGPECWMILGAYQCFEVKACVKILGSFSLHID